ncbi:hypothetical protein KCU95_g12833, partial [Aureobasidium melanogenum]
MPPVKFNPSEPTPKMPKLSKKKSFKALIHKENAERKKEFEFQKACVTSDDEQMNCLTDDLEKKAKIGK